MLVHTTPTQNDAIVRAMKCVARGNGAVAFAADDRPKGFAPIA